MYDSIRILTIMSEIHPCINLRLSCYDLNATDKWHILHQVKLISNTSYICHLIGARMGLNHESYLILQTCSGREPQRDHNPRPYVSLQYLLRYYFCRWHSRHCHGAWIWGVRHRSWKSAQMQLCLKWSEDQTKVDLLVFLYSLYFADENK